MEFIIVPVMSIVLVLFFLGGILQTRRSVSVQHCIRCHTPFEFVPGGHNDVSGLCEDCYVTAIRDSRIRLMHSKILNLPIR